MTTFDYVARRTKAAALITKFGQTATLLQAGAMVGPAWAATPGQDQPSAVTVVVTAQEEMGSTDGVASRLKKTMLMAAPNSAVPTKKDRLLINGITHEVLDVRPLSPGGVVVFYELDAAA